MEKVTANGIVLVFPPVEHDIVEVIEGACDKTITLVKENWGLNLPEECHIYVMTSPTGFFFRSAPCYWKIILAVTVPLWYWRVRRTWPYSAAWTQRFGKRVVIGIKPNRLWEQSDRSIGQRIFVKEIDNNANIQHVTCHELVHACSVHLKLPAWLNEGIAVITTEWFKGESVVMPETLTLIKNYIPKVPPPTYYELSRMGKEAISYHGIRGYWIVRYIEEMCPGFFKSMFSLRRDTEILEREVAEQVGMKPDGFWGEIDDIVVNHFKR